MLEYLVLLAAVVSAANHYYDNQLIHFVYQKYRKYFNVLMILLVGLFVFYSLQMQTTKWKHMIEKTNRFLPDDMQQAIHPLMDFTERTFEVSRPVNTRDGGGKIARNVTEKTKKLVAASQDWDCAICSNRLPATFEVDHILRLEYGGDNSVENLQALCPNCHRYKTMTETKP